MNLDQAQQLISQLGIEFGGSVDAYQMDEQCRLNLTLSTACRSTSSSMKRP